MNKYVVGDIVCVHWLDAIGSFNEDKEAILGVRPNQHLVKTKTYGVVGSIDEIAVLLLQEDSETKVDYKVIPKGLIESVEVLK